MMVLICTNEVAETTQESLFIRTLVNRFGRKGDIYTENILSYKYR